MVSRSGGAAEAAMAVPTTSSPVSTTPTVTFHKKLRIACSNPLGQPVPVASPPSCESFIFPPHQRLVDGEVRSGWITRSATLKSVKRLATL